MSLSVALANAVSGLQVSSKRAETVAHNVAHAGDAGYARRSVAATPISHHVAGVRTEVVRHADPASQAMRREADGRAAGADVSAAFWGRVDAAVGDPDDPASLSAKLVALEAVLIDATTQPGSPERLAEVSRAAGDAAAAINGAAAQVEDARGEADAAIAQAVSRLNDDLKGVETLNVEIARASALGGDPSTLMDQRAALLDRVGEAVAVRILPRDFGAVAVVSEGGQILLDPQARPVGFEASHVAPHRTRENGALDVLTVAGREVPAAPKALHMGGGRLEALFRLRDVEAPAAQARLDALAAETIGRFEAADGTLAAGEAGLFVDPDGGVPAAGLAGRIAIHPRLVEGPTPGSPPEYWRVRDGFGAAAVQDPAAPVGRLDALIDAMGLRSVPGDPLLGTGARDLHGLAADVKSAFSAARAGSERRADEAGATAAAARDRDAEASGVDVEEEMRRLIEIEQAYAASARVIEVADEMMQRLTRL